MQVKLTSGRLGRLCLRRLVVYLVSPLTLWPLEKKMQTETIGTEEALDMIKGFRRQLSSIQEKINPHYI
jgi:hypothetical protein